MREASRARQREERIVLPETLRNPHPLVKQSAEILKSSELNIIWIIEPCSKKDCLSFPMICSAVNPFFSASPYSCQVLF
jgi:hypothetical protein